MERRPPRPADFRPPRLLRNPHVQSVLASSALRRLLHRRRNREVEARSSEVLLDCGDGVRLQGFHAATPARPARGLVVLLHGWEGSAQSSYMLGVGRRLLDAGYDVFRLNFRDHGATHHLNREIFHSCRIDEVLVEGEAGFREARDFMRMLMPSQARKVQAYREPTPLFVKHRVEDHLAQIYSPVTPLKSGGYLVINQTEALVAIDVNSGRATRERNVEATALRTNLEAAEEAARQLRLRDLAGLVVIDFIDMDESKNNRAVEKKLKDALKEDRARIQVGRISSFGLMELSRQRRRSSLLEGTTHVCERR